MTPPPTGQPEVPPDLLGLHRPARAGLQRAFPLLVLAGAALGLVADLLATRPWWPLVAAHGGLGVAAVVLLVLLPRTGTVVSREGLRVRDLVPRRPVPWQDVVRVVPGRPHEASRAVRRAGRDLALHGVTPEVARRLADALDARGV